MTENTKIFNLNPQVSGIQCIVVIRMWTCIGRSHPLSSYTWLMINHTKMSSEMISWHPHIPLHQMCLSWMSMESGANALCLFLMRKVGFTVPLPLFVSQLSDKSTYTTIHGSLLVLAFTGICIRTCGILRAAHRPAGGHQPRCSLCRPIRGEDHLWWHPATCPHHRGGTRQTSSPKPVWSCCQRRCIRWNGIHSRLLRVLLSQ